MEGVSSSWWLASNMPMALLLGLNFSVHDIDKRSQSSVLAWPEYGISFERFRCGFLSLSTLKLVLVR